MQTVLAVFRPLDAVIKALRDSFAMRDEDIWIEHLHAGSLEVIVQAASTSVAVIALFVEPWKLRRAGQPSNTRLDAMSKVMLAEAAAHGGTLPKARAQEYARRIDAESDQLQGVADAEVEELTIRARPLALTGDSTPMGLPEPKNEGGK